MSSKWVEIRDNALDALKQGAIEVGEETKQKFMSNFIESGLPVIEAVAEQFKATVQEQAAKETGWCKIRDAIVIPFAIDLALWIGKKILAMVSNATATEAVAMD